MGFIYPSDYLIPNVMTSFSDILQAAKFVEEQGYTYSLEKSWMQGRAIYGGLSTSLCLHGVLQQHPDLPPLRSVNVNFIGPASPDVYVKSSVLRRGKSVAFIQGELWGEAGLITQAVFGFGAERKSRLDAVYSEPRQVIHLERAEPFFPTEGPFSLEGGSRPAFTQHFEVRLIKGNRPFTGANEPSFELWVKHKDAQAKGLLALVALADMSPPGVLPVFTEFAPISSLSWMFNLIKTDLSNESGWWLMKTEAEHARHGYSSQDMKIWNDKGELVVVGRQNVAIFY